MQQVNIVNELCAEGTLFDLLVKYGAKGLKEQQVIHVLKDLSRGILHMHSQDPPIAHRVIKVENVLLRDKKFKLCDFGSASTAVLNYENSILSESNVDMMFEDFEKYTTMMYRPPEMIDKYMKWGVNTKVDIWVSRQ